MRKSSSSVAASPFTSLWPRLPGLLRHSSKFLSQTRLRNSNESAVYFTNGEASFMKSIQNSVKV